MLENEAAKKQQQTVRMYKDALQSQDACNLLALANAFARYVKQLYEEAQEQGRGSEWINTHPVCVLFAEQIRHLTGNGSQYAQAWDECKAKSTTVKDVLPQLRYRIIDSSGGCRAYRVDSLVRKQFVLIYKEDNDFLPDDYDTTVDVHVFNATGSEETDYEQGALDGATVSAHALVEHVGRILT